MFATLEDESCDFLDSARDQVRAAAFASGLGLSEPPFAERRLSLVTPIC